VDWNQPAPDIHNRIRGLQPWPVATVMWRGRRLRLLGSVPEDLNDEKSHRAVESDENLSRRDFLPGTIVAVDEDSFVVACHPGAVRIVRVQVEGRAPTAVREFLHGHHVSAGDTLEPLPTDI
jgi:methionyl-tRNA formyltransferase